MINILPKKTSSKIFFGGLFFTTIILLIFNISLLSLLPIGFVLFIAFIVTQSNEEDGTIKNYGQSTTEEKLKYNLMELILKLAKNVESEVEIEGDRVLLSYNKDKIIINKEGTVSYNKNLIMIKDSYGKYIYNHIDENFYKIYTVKNILKNITGTLITEDQVISRLETDIRTALNDTRQIQIYMGEIQKIREKYLIEYANMNLVNIPQVKTKV